MTAPAADRAAEFQRQQREVADLLLSQTDDVTDLAMLAAYWILVYSGAASAGFMRAPPASD